MATVVVLVILGVLLLVAEIVIIPGFGFAGIAGGIAIVGGVILSYNINSATGNLTVLSTTVLVAVAIYFSLRAKTWQRLALHKSIDSAVDVSPALKNISIGDEGITITRLSPTGKVRINDIYVEARSILEFIEHDKKVVVVKFEDSKVIVKEIKLQD